MTMRDDSDKDGLREQDPAAWFDENWMHARDRALSGGWEALPRRDQVLVAVGFLIDSLIGSGVEMVVDGILTGHDEGLTIHMPGALREIGEHEAARHMDELIRLRTPTGSAPLDAANRRVALDHWCEVGKRFREETNDGARRMLVMLHDWHQAHGNG